MFSRLISKLSLAYTDPIQEKEYLELKIPLNKEFFKYLSFGMAFLFIPLTVRYYIKNWFPQTYIGIGFIVLGVLVFLLKDRISRFMQFISLVFISAALAVAMYNFYIALPFTEPLEAFYMGYGFALIAKIVDFRVTNFYLAVGFNLAFMVTRFSFISSSNIEQMVLIIILEILPIFLSFQTEKADRLLFDSLYKSKNLLIKFKQLLTEYLPNPIAVLTSDYSQMSFVNDAFKKLFKLTDADDIKSALDNLVLDDQDCEENKLLLRELDCTSSDVEDFTSLRFFKLMKMLSHKREIFSESDVISFQLVEQQVVKVDEPPKKRKQKKKVTILLPPEDQSPIAKLGLSKNMTKSEDISLIDKSQLGITRKELDIQDIPLVMYKHLSEEQNELVVADPPEQKVPQTDSQELKRRVFKAKMFPLTWDNQEAIALVLDDVTHERTIMELKIADKNKDLVIATVSHELRTPLNGMLGLLEIMKKEITQPEIMVYLNACKANSRLLLNLVNSILDLSQIKNSKLRLIYSKVVINDLLAEAKSLFDHFCQIKRICLEIEIDSNVPQFMITDRTRLSQIIINLLGNAFKFTFKGGVTLKVALEHDDPNKIKFSVIDTGIGIKKEDQEKLFKLFGRLEQQDKINTQGVGLGLTISNNLAILLNSVDKTGIQVESELGKGTIFSFTVQSENKDRLENTGESESEETMSEDIHENAETSRTVLERMTSYTELRDKQMSFSPLKFKSAYAITGSDSRRSMSYTRNDWKKTGSHFLTVPEMAGVNQYKKEKSWCLIVDDNPFNLMVAINAMKERGYQVKTALNGQEAISTVKEHNNSTGRIQIILMDCQMPVMDGYEASKIGTDDESRGY